MAPLRKIQAIPCNLLQQTDEDGFTLLELMIVMIIVSIFATISLSSFIQQTGKARESEVKTIVGAVNRSQQAYHWEKGQFAQGFDDQNTLALLNMSVNSRYVSTYNIVGSISLATVAPVNGNYQLDNTKAYSGRVSVFGGSYIVTICQSPEPIAGISPAIGDGDCGTNNILR